MVSKIYVHKSIYIDIFFKVWHSTQSFTISKSFLMQISLKRSKKTELPSLLIYSLELEELWVFLLDTLLLVEWRSSTLLLELWQNAVKRFWQTFLSRKRWEVLKMSKISNTSYVCCKLNTIKLYSIHFDMFT